MASSGWSSTKRSNHPLLKAPVNSQTLAVYYHPNLNTETAATKNPAQVILRFRGYTSSCSHRRIPSGIVGRCRTKQRTQARDSSTPLGVTALLHNPGAVPFFLRWFFKKTLRARFDKQARSIMWQVLQNFIGGNYR